MTQNEIKTAIQSLKDWLGNQTKTPEYKQRGGIGYKEANKLKAFLIDMRDKLPHLSFNNDSLRSRLDAEINDLTGGKIDELESGLSMMVNSSFQPKELMIEYLSSKIEPIIKTLTIYCEHLAGPLVSGQPDQWDKGGTSVVRIKISGLGKKQGKHVALLNELSASAKNRVKIDSQRHGKDPLRVLRRCKTIDSTQFHKDGDYIYCEKKVVLE